jgi:diguanylate cyclase (GGDEF)-like protein/PAS domain S-box-containing protein
MQIRFSTRLIIFVVLLQAVMLLLLTWNNGHLLTASHADIFENMVQVEGRLLNNALAPGLAYDDAATLQDVFDQLSENEGITYAEVRGRHGHSMAILGQPPAQWHADSDFQSALGDGVYDVEQSVLLAGQQVGTVRVGYSLDRLIALNERTGFQNTLIALVGIALTLSATLVIVLFLTRNLRKLEQGAQALSRDQRDYRIAINDDGEFGTLATAFNQLAEHLDETQTALQKQHGHLERETRFLQTLLDGIDAVVMEAAMPGYQFTYVSREAENLMGYTVEQWLQPNFWAEHVAPEDRGWLEETIASHFAKGDSFTVDFRMVHQQGHSLWVRAINSVEQDDSGRAVIRGLLLDISEQKTAEDRIVYLAEHDALTGLINRRRFQKELERSIAYAQRYQQQGAILLVDLDQFKYINDTYGHQYGDEYLLDVSRRLERVLRRTDILGRLGGDEFGVIIPKCTLDEVRTVGMALLGALAQENLEQGGKVVPVSASIGIALFPSQSAVPSDLLAKADAAMYTAKRRGRGQVHVFSEEDDELWNMQAKIHWEERIRWALAEDRFHLFFQPVVDIRNGLITHYEVLLRMQGEDGEMIAPGAFIETAERFGLIRDIDRWVVRHAIKTQAETITAHRPVNLAINLSGRHFGNDSMLKFIQEAIETHGADPGSLMFEVTETEAVENLSKAREFIDDLRALGCRFALDDFGIGFSSFHYLRNLPVDYIKIDGSFVRNLHTDSDDRLFVKAIVDLATGLQIPCIAEFVENGHIIEVLADLGVDYGQGYHLARPAPNFHDSPLLKMDD